MTIAIVNYGVGNLRSVKNAFDFLGVGSTIVDHPTEISAARKIVLPGVGAFGSAMRNIADRGMDRALVAAVENGAMVLGVCLGMQLLASEGEEGGRIRGLGLIGGRVVRLRPPAGLRVPHIGFNTVDVTDGHSGLFDSLVPRREFYFIHSYHFVPDDRDAVIGTAQYGGEVICAVRDGPVMGVQFHPEKSQQNGLQLLKNFAEMSQ